MRQRRREQYLGVTKPQLVDAAQRLFARSEEASVVIVGKDGGDELLQEFRDKQFSVQRFAMDAAIPMDMEDDDDDDE
jgi:Zn-dependent M16 (insulinase) family peptidase